MPLTLSGTNGVSGVDGSASTPANRGSDTNTGVVYGTDTVQIATGGTTAVTVDSSQNVGIGTASTNGYGAGFVTLQSNGSTGGLVQASYGTTTAIAEILTTSGEGRFGTRTNHPMTFKTNNAEAARIDTSGNLLVGTTSSSARLTISGPASASYANGVFYVYSNTAGDTTYTAFTLQKYDNNTTTSQKFATFLINNGGAASGYITANGANAATFTSSSDARLKENIELLPSQLANICALKPSEFDYKDGTGHQIGFIAQDMEQVYPDCVAPNDDGMLMISGWSKTEARLVKAIQELSAKLDAAEARIAALEAK